MNAMFQLCGSLISLPDISKWNTSKVTNISYIINYCHSLISLPDISKWDTSKVADKKFMFYEIFNILNIKKICNSIMDIYLKYLNFQKTLILYLSLLKYPNLIYQVQILKNDIYQTLHSYL